MDKIGTSFDIILPSNVALKVYVIIGIENIVDQMDHATLVTDRMFGLAELLLCGLAQMTELL